mmetsp:Transcript_18166/g.32939  ORF Transcript_18166/g.32939 Transcript_18166/m.32939 type:complete len:316 (-) Transcript_18166:714-1661(-)
MVRDLFRWLSRAEATALKHQEGWHHPLAACILHYMIVLVSTTLVHDHVVIPLLSTGDEDYLGGTTTTATESHDTKAPSFVSRDHIAICLVLYVVVSQMGRISCYPTALTRRAALYEFTWMCNTTLVLGAWALYTNRPLMASAPCVAVSIDQVLWYADLFGWALSGFRKFPIGVAKYLTWPITPWITIFTCTHHLWTIPLLVYGAGGLHWAAFPFSIFIVVSNVLLSRWLTPFTIQRIKKNDDNINTEELKYLNVNLSHEVWKDIQFGFCQCVNTNKTLVVYMFRLLWRWQLFNLIVFTLILYPLFFKIYGHAPLD